MLRDRVRTEVKEINFFILLDIKSLSLLDFDRSVKGQTVGDCFVGLLNFTRGISSAEETGKQVIKELKDKSQKLRSHTNRYHSHVTFVFVLST